MANLYMPVLNAENPPAPANPRGFGIGIPSQNLKLPYQRVITLLRPPCWHDWGSKRQKTEWQPNNYPCIWNPFPAGKMALAFDLDFARRRPGQWWLIGNEPLDAHERAAYWQPENMAEQANIFGGETGCQYVICGEVPDAAGLAYTRRVAELCRPAGYHFHIYRLYDTDFVKDLEICMRFAGDKPIFVTETNARNGNVDSQKRLMDTIVRCLERWPQVHAVFWFASYWPACPSVEILLTHNGPDCQLTETGRHYVDIQTGAR